LQKCRDGPVINRDLGHGGNGRNSNHFNVKIKYYSEQELLRPDSPSDRFPDQPKKPAPNRVKKRKIYTRQMK
jgi:hypothetical protein